FISGNGTGEVTDGVQWVYPLNGIHQRPLVFFSEFSSVSNSGLKVVISESDGFSYTKGYHQDTHQCVALV
ncbi:hypothetical protein Tco_1472592, partial [Tanacetum coccineum]